MLIPIYSHALFKIIHQMAHDVFISVQIIQIHELKCVDVVIQSTLVLVVAMCEQNGKIPTTVATQGVAPDSSPFIDHPS